MDRANHAAMRGAVDGSRIVEQTVVDAALTFGWKIIPWLL
jgi:hypothetical protein